MSTFCITWMGTTSFQNKERRSIFKFGEEIFLFAFLQTFIQILMGVENNFK